MHQHPHPRVAAGTPTLAIIEGGRSFVLLVAEDLDDEELDALSSHNLAAYRRLFPDAVGVLFERTGRLSNLADLRHCFLYPTLQPACPIAEFFTEMQLAAGDAP